MCLSEGMVADGLSVVPHEAYLGDTPAPTPANRLARAKSQVLASNSKPTTARRAVAVHGEQSLTESPITSWARISGGGIPASLESVSSPSIRHPEAIRARESQVLRERV
jgi:hypothetical protein